MKRSRNLYIDDSVSSNTRSKKPRLVEPLKRVIRSYPWISATQTYNYMRNDCLVDWLKMCNKNSSNNFSFSIKKSNGFGDFLMEKGNLFEETVVSYLEKIVPVVTISEYITEETVQKTIELMRKGTPIIHSAPFLNIYNKTKGVIDLLVRSDYIDRFIAEPPFDFIENKGAPLLETNYHYVVIDIKFCTLPLRADGIHLLNSGSFSAYKVQTYIYNKAIGNIQGYTPRYTYILGRRWKYKKNGITFSNNSSLSRLGVIDFKGIDKPLVEYSNKSLSWARNVTLNAQKWSIFPPSRKELYPNMNVDSGKWQKHKEIISNKLGEITSIWYCGIKHRINALKSGITSWRDNKCSSKTLGYKGKRGTIIDKILNINRQSKHKLLPTVIKTNLHNWRSIENEIFVDFETFADVFASLDSFPIHKSTDMIFMIGIYYKNEGSWNYTNYIASQPTREAEYEIMNSFYKFIQNRGNPKIWYWCAEKRFWNTSKRKQCERIDDVQTLNYISECWGENNWKDLSEIFKNEPIVIKDCFKYGLKHVAKAMRKHCMINTKIESKCDSGMIAMVTAWECYQIEGDAKNHDTMKDIAKYNEFDCTVLKDIIYFLRNNY